eukprot:1160174-Pelagomonas_calceolata.AAC.4
MARCIYRLLASNCNCESGTVSLLELASNCEAHAYVVPVPVLWPARGLIMQLRWHGVIARQVVTHACYATSHTKALYVFAKN